MIDKIYLTCCSDPGDEQEPITTLNINDRLIDSLNYG